MPRLGAGSAVGSVAHVWEWLWEQLCPPRVLVTTRAQCPLLSSPQPFSIERDLPAQQSSSILCILSTLFLGQDRESGCSSWALSTFELCS